MTELTLTLAAARALHLAAQGLLQPRRKKAQKSDVPDTLHVVARSPSLLLWRRLGGYPQAALAPVAGISGMAGMAGEAP